MTVDRGPRPTVTLKIATSLDGRIATADGQSRWITGEAAREEVHRLRAAHDAVLVGSQTVIDDDPELTVRLPGYDGPQPLRVVADARLRTPLKSKLVRTAFTEDTLSSPRTYIVTAQSNDPLGGARVHDESDAELVLERLSEDDYARSHVRMGYAPAMLGGGLVPSVLLDRISGTLAMMTPQPVARAVLLEGGGKLAASFFGADLIDRIEWFRAPIILGGDARPAVATLALQALADAPRFKRAAVRELGDDLWESYERAASSA